jgi:hypothetical protein
MTELSSNPSEQSKELFPTFRVVGRRCLTFGSWILAPNIFPWREVDRKSPEKLEFRSGGELTFLVFGILLVGLGIFFAAISLQSIPNVIATIRFGLAQKDYGLVSGAWFEAATLFFLAFEALIPGIWFVCGRIVIHFDKTSGMIAKDFRLLSCCLYRKGCHLQEADSVSLRPNPRWRRSFFSHGLYLDRHRGKPLKLISVADKYIPNGLRIAKRISEFLGVPGPAERNSPNPQNPG